MSPKEARKSLQNTNNRTETVKARIKATGEIIELNEKVSFLDYARGIYRDTDGNKYHYEELEIFEREYEKHIDWEQRRYEISKAMIAAFMSNSDKNVFAYPKKNQARDAVEYADALIEELKKRK